MKLLSRALLPFSVFVTGACVLIIEIAATRILAPYFGNTIYSVSSVISVVLAALSVGYWFGGRLADSRPSKKVFFAIITVSGIAVLCIELARSSLLPTLGYTLPLSVGPLIMATILFFMPSFILGMLSPFAIALQQRQTKDQGVGTTAGQMFFFSTLGSIAGSLLAGFWLIPFFGVTAVVVGVGIVLFLLGIAPLSWFGFERRLTVVLVLLAGSLLALVSVNSPSYGWQLYSRDGIYERINIFEGTYNGRPARFLMQDTSNSAAMYLDSDELVYDYTKYYGLYDMFAPNPQKTLVLGGGAYSIPKALLADLPNVTVDVSEIEPSLVPLSKQYFRLNDDPRLTHYIEDGRRMLHDTPNQYDVIFSDVYHSMYSIPTHFTTREFMELVHSRLTENGVFMANLIGTTNTQGQSFIWSEIKTMQAVFPQVYVFAVRDPLDTKVQNIIAVGSKFQQRIDIHDAKWRESAYQVVREAASHYVPVERMSLKEHLVLTDNYAPIDYLTSKVLPKR